MKKLLSIICLFSLSPYSYSENPLLDIDHSIIPKNITNNAIALRDRALSDNLSVEIVESLTTEVGSRRMGSHLAAMEKGLIPMRYLHLLPIDPRLQRGSHRPQYLMPKEHARG